MHRLWALCFFLGGFLLVAQSNDEFSTPHAEMPIEEDTPEEDEEEGSEDQESVWSTEEEQLSEAQLRKMHEKIDQNADKKLSMAEVLEFFKGSRMGIANKQSAEDFESSDTNKDGKVSMEEMIEHRFGAPLPDDIELSQTPEQVAEGKIIAEEKDLETKKFKVADLNGDGFLDKTEFSHTAFPDTHDAVLSLVAAVGFKGLDKDKDGGLTFDEFLHHAGETTDGEEPTAEQKEEEKVNFEKLDVDKNGKLSGEEYKVWESEHFHMKEAMTQLFEIADEDGDQHLTASELVAAQPALANSIGQMQLQEWAEHYEL